MTGNQNSGTKERKYWKDRDNWDQESPSLPDAPEEHTHELGEVLLKPNLEILSVLHTEETTWVQNTYSLCSDCLTEPQLLFVKLG